eukprot:g2586.t1 g2586   contig12:407497-408861(-)
MKSNSSTPSPSDDIGGSSISEILPSKNCSTSSPLIPRIIAGSIGSIVTALAVTPLEVVKIRQQSFGAHSAQTTSASTQMKLEPCPRGCTVVLNVNTLECVLPKTSPNLDRAVDNAPTKNFTRIFNSTSQSFVPKSGGTLQTLLSIWHYEGFSGLYAGLRPTLLMSVPNTVLYFSAYDEISMILRRNHANNTTAKNNGLEDTHGIDYECNNSSLEDAKRQAYIPLVAGSTARLLASLTTAPLELIRTRQASIVPNSRNGNGVMAVPGMVEEFRNLLRINGLSSLYVGLAPTLWRDVPFSALYWLCLERFRNELSDSDSLGAWGGRYYSDQGMKLPPSVEASHSFVSGAAAGSVAAAMTTPFDVVKTRRQMVDQTISTLSSQWSGSKFCNESKQSAAVGSDRINVGTFGHIRQIVTQEGISGLWRGNLTRMLKISPACAVMISTYEVGKRFFGDVL